MPDLQLLAVIGALIPLAAALIVRFGPATPPRALVLLSAFAPFLLGAVSFGLDTLSWLAMVLFSGVAFVTLLAAPKRDRTKEETSNALLVLGGTVAAFATGNLIVLLAGWIVSAVPIWKRPAGAKGSWMLPRAILLAGAAALAVAIGLLAADAMDLGSAAPFSLSALHDMEVIDSRWIFGLLVVAVLSRKGVVPLHFALISSIEHGSLLNSMLYMNGHVGIYLLARLAMPLMPVTSHEAFSPLADLALLSAGITCLMALTETSPRRLLGLLSISQASFVLAGLESSSEIGVNGAIVYMLVLSVSTTGLFIVLRLLEVRVSTPLTLSSFHGFAARVPRLAAFFLMSALALVGLPGTVGFVAEDLLFHGTLESHPELGLIMPIATALNAITLLRIFARLFMGKRNIYVPHVADALPAERWALTAALVAIVLFGVQPELLLHFTRATVAGMLP